jgi:hypothetical protein
MLISFLSHVDTRICPGFMNFFLGSESPSRLLASHGLEIGVRLHGGFGSHSKDSSKFKSLSMPDGAVSVISDSWNSTASSISSDIKLNWGKDYINYRSDSNAPSSVINNDHASSSALVGFRES